MFLARRAQGQTRYAVRPDKPRPAGTLALPGDAAALRWLEDSATDAVMVHDPHGQTLTAVARVSHPAYVLLSPDEQLRRVRPRFRGARERRAHERHPRRHIPSTAREQAVIQSI